MLEGSPSRLKLSAVLAGLLLGVGPSPAARGEEPKLSISGYDPVAYFTDGKPVQGRAEIEYLWHKLRWRFASDAHRDLFSKTPDRYAPQYDGYCAMGVSNDADAHKDTVDPEAWAIVDGKLYLVHNQYWLGIWREHSEEYIKRANASWQALADRAEPAIVGPPCPASPPTTKVALRDSGHWVVVGGQVARDEAGNVVGKGNLQQQIEQVGKNVGACLEAGVQPSRTSSLRSATSNSPPSSTNTPICASAISARPRRTVRSSRCRHRPTPICSCRSKPSPRPRSREKLASTRPATSDAKTPNLLFSLPQRCADSVDIRCRFRCFSASLI